MTPNQAFDQWYDTKGRDTRRTSTTIQRMQAAYEAGAAHGVSSRTPDWQPMDTAPMDRRILVKTADGRVNAAEWGQPYGPWAGPGKSADRWRIPDTDDMAERGYAEITPIGWMPLPSP